MAHPARNARPQAKQFMDATTVEFCLSLASENAVKTQIWCAIATYVLIAIIENASLKKHRFHAPCSKLSQPPTCTARSFCSTSNRTLVMLSPVLPCR